ncbi:MAG: transposase family protein [Phormidesmis sp.]
MGIISNFHGVDSALRLRYLPLFEVPVFVEVRPKRYRCGFCKGNPTSIQQLSWHEPRSPNTKLYERWLLRMMINATVVDVAKKLNLKSGVVTGVLDRWLAKRVN